MPAEPSHALQERIQAIREQIRSEGEQPSGAGIQRVDLEPDLQLLQETQVPGSSLSPGELSACIEHTLLKAEATPTQILQVCSQAVQYRFATACVNPRFAKLAARAVDGSTVRVCCVVGFPLGASRSSVKAFEAERAIQDGASEIDMVLPIGELLEKQFRQVYLDIRTVAEASHDLGALLKVIVETSELDQDQIIAACLLSRDAGADFVKTSTGFGTGGAARQDVALMRAVVGDDLGVKASGGIRNLADALEMIDAGADRLGTSSGVHILRQALGDRIEQQTVMGY